MYPALNREPKEGATPEARESAEWHRQDRQYWRDLAQAVSERKGRMWLWDALALEASGSAADVLLLMNEATITDIAWSWVKKQLDPPQG